MRKELLLSREELAYGTFVKTDSPQVIEVLGTTRLHFAVIDAEHAPFDRMTIDRMLIAGRACDLPIVVRLPDRTAATTLTMLDMGAAGLLVPHVDTAEEARAVVSNARFRAGQRGMSISPRYANYGALSRHEAIKLGDAARVLCQIESREAVANVEAIAAVDGVDALFIGRADLAMSMGEDDPGAPSVEEAILRIANAARGANKVCAMHVSNRAEATRRAAAGISWFVVSSDQGLLRSAALEIA